MWCGLDNVERIDTHLDNGSDQSGWWYVYGDSAAGGASRIVWPVPRGTDYSAESFQPIIEYCNGMCGTFVLDKGNLTYDPLVGIGFNVAGTDRDGDLSHADGLGWGGMCITYTSDVEILVELHQGDEIDAAAKYDLPSIKLAKTFQPKQKCSTWDDFVQDGWGLDEDGIVITGPEAANNLTSINFKIQGKDGTTGTFNIMSLGTYNGQ